MSCRCACVGGLYKYRDGLDGRKSDRGVSRRHAYKGGTRKKRTRAKKEEGKVGERWGRGVRRRGGRGGMVSVGSSVRETAETLDPRQRINGLARRRTGDNYPENFI